MTSINAPDILSFSRLSQQITDLKNRADAARAEATTGRRHDLTAATNGDIGGAHLLKKAVNDVQAYQTLLKLAQNRSQRTQIALGALGGEAVRIGSETLSAAGRQDQQAIAALSSDARAAISNIFSVLNTTDGGRALFGGNVTDRAPLAPPEAMLADIDAIVAGAADAANAQAQIDAYFNDPAGGFMSSVYQGGDQKAPPVEIAPGIRIDASATAADQPIRDLLRGLASIAAYPQASFADKNALLEDAAGASLSADAAITELRSVIGVGESRIAASIDRYEAEETILTSLYNARTSRDQFEAASELQLLETQLEASYLLTARLARLTIADYIR